MAISKEIQKSSEMKFNGKLIQSGCYSDCGSNRG